MSNDNIKVEIAQAIESGENPYISKFEEFFRTKYKSEVEEVSSAYPEKQRVSIRYSDLEKFDISLADAVLHSPDYLLESAEHALKRLDFPNLARDDIELRVAICELPNDKIILIRDIDSKHIGKLVTIDGMISHATDVLPKLRVGKFACLHCNRTFNVHQENPDKVAEPYGCECGRRNFKLLEGESIFVGYQDILIQEPLEILRSSEQAKRLNITVEEDLVGKVVPGERLKFTGVLRLKAPKNKGTVYGRILEAVHIQRVNKEFSDFEVTEEELKQIQEIASKPNVYELLVKSVAPSIYGHDAQKEAIALQMFGGVKKTLADGSSKRGDFHVLLIGDPGTGKSQLLKYANQLSPKSIYVGGKMASSAGLSASAEKDEATGSWMLKAGALVLASGGLAVIDEMDKMAEEDSSALHESMEQQTISVAKAGMVSTFKTETSVLAAANPKHGRFNPMETIMKQIEFPPTLMSRFDLYYILRDDPDTKKDAETADHILNTHRIGSIRRLKNEGNVEVNLKELEEGEKGLTPAIERELFRKYVSYAKRNVFPILSTEANSEIKKFYQELRKSGGENSVAITARQLDALVRLSEASARVRLSNTATIDDAKRAIKLLHTALREVGTDPVTGKIDMDIIMTGTAQSEVKQLRNVLDVVKSLSEEFENVPIDKVVEEAEKAGIPSNKVTELIDRLKREGELYSPRHGVVRIAGG